MARNSKKCKFAPCGNTVNLKNYPNGYCWIHQEIPNRRIKVNGLSTAEYNRTVKKFRMPGKLSRTANLSHDIKGGGNFPTQAARTLVEEYMEPERGDITIPNNAKTVRDDEIENTINNLESQGSWRKLDLVTVESGMAMNPDGTMSPRDEKKLIYGEEEKSGARFLMDPRISILSGGDQDTSADEEYESGSTPFGDGVYADVMTKFCGGATMTWDGVVDSDGKEIYERPKLERFENEDHVKSMRELLNNGAVYVPQEVDYSFMTNNKRRETVSREEAEKSLNNSYTETSEYWEEDSKGFDFNAAERRAKE